MQESMTYSQMILIFLYTGIKETFNYIHLHCQESLTVFQNTQTIDISKYFAKNLDNIFPRNMLKQTFINS